MVLTAAQARCDDDEPADQGGLLYPTVFFWLSGRFSGSESVIGALAAA